MIDTDWEVEKLLENVMGKQIVHIDVSDTEIILELEGGVALFISGGYCKDVYYELKRKVVKYESI